MSVWDKSSFLDLVSNGITTGATPELAYGITSPEPFTGTIRVALVLPRLNDPTALLSGTYAQRQAVLNGLTAEQVGATYGASQAQYDALRTYLGTVGGVSLSDSNTLVSSAASRTVWITTSSQGFQTLFGTPLKTSSLGFVFWDGTLTPSAGLGTLAALFPVVGGSQPTIEQPTTAGVTLTEGPQGVGNTAGGGYQAGSTGVGVQALFPNQIAALYHFPVTATPDGTLATPTIGLLQPGFGDAVAAGNNANQLVQAYRATAGVTGTGTISEGLVEKQPSVPTSSERSLDVGVVAAVAPNSDIITYAGNGGLYSATQEAIWGPGPKVGMLSTSYSYGQRFTGGSPFALAVSELYTDAALNNITVFVPSGDGGSSGEVATGQPAILSGVDSPYNVVVGGTSTSGQAQVAAAGAAVTGGNINSGIASLLTDAIAKDPAALEILVAGGLLQQPTAATNIRTLLQTAWNQYHYDASTGVLNHGYQQNEATGGGVDPDLAEPAYQQDAGIDTRALQAAAGVTPAETARRGIPDVSALAGGNSTYKIPTADLTGITTSGGTSASTPLWAALAAQIQAVFTDQGLPALGTITDLLYQAAAIDPAAFDDVQFGSNTSSFYQNPDGTVSSAERSAAGQPVTFAQITPTGLGYTAAPGYDLTTGLGTPNGILLARALTKIAQTQIHSPDAVAVTDSTGQASAALQALIVQPTLTTGFAGTIGVGGATFAPASTGSGLGWSARIAQQVLQSYFDPSLAIAIGGQAQASSTQVTATSGQALGVTIGGTAAAATAQVDTSPFGFVTYTAAGQSVTLARPLAVAHTYGGQDDTNAILRIRQETTDNDKLTFYRVDDLVGTIDGVAPGSSGYEAAVASRYYRTPEGNYDLGGPGEGRFRQTTLTNVDNGDIIGFRLKDLTSGQTSWGLAAQNADGANDLWSYGADTWGFNDGSEGGDGYNSLVFQLDFTSSAGSGLLAFDATPACFLAGTLIATPSGERPVEHLAIGDQVLTSGGEARPIRWIGRRSYAGRFLAAQPGLHPVRFRPGSLGDGLPRRDLLVSPEHAALIEGVLVPARCLVDGEAVVHEAGLESVDYVHIELDAHAAILAEGAAFETFEDDDSRGIFHNAAEYRVLYPDAVARPARFCADRLREGEALAALRRRVAERRAPPPAGGTLLGCLETATPTRISGWAFDAHHPDRKVRLRITADDVVLGIVTADRERPSLRKAGYGDGRLGFELVLDTALPTGRPCAIHVTRLEDGAALTRARVTIQPGPDSVPAAPPTLTRTLRGFVDDVTRARIRGWAWDPAAPHEPVGLQVVANGAIVATGTANRFRGDLLSASIGNGWHGFEITIPGGLSPLARHVIELRRDTDGARLPVEPGVIEPTDSFGPDLERAVHHAVSALEDSPQRDRVLSFMLAQAERLRHGPARPPASSGAAGPRALVIDERLPDMRRDAGSQAVMSHMRTLQGLGYAVSLAAVNDAGDGQDAAALAASGIALYAPPRHPSVEDVLRRESGRFDVVYLHRHGTASRYLGLVRAHQPRAQVIYSVADLHHVRMARQAALFDDARLRDQSRRMRDAEFGAAAAADAVITHSTAEAAMLRRALPRASVHCVGWAPEPRRMAVPFARRSGVAFVGSFDHAPNLDAVSWLVQDVLPLVWRENPAITCTLAGSAMPASVRRLAGPGLVVAGHVDDLHALFSQVRLTVAPLRFGAGLKGKVLDSMAAGLPCALTPIAAEGLALSPLLRSTIGRSAAEMAAIILRLHESQGENRRVAAAGRRLIARDFSQSSVTAGLTSVLAADACEGGMRGVG